MVFFFHKSGSHFHSCHRKCNAITAKTQYEVRILELFVLTDVRQTVFGFAESSGPGKIGIKLIFR